MNLKETRKSQSTVISTVLIILLVIALVAILAYVISSFVINAGDKISYDCEDLQLTLSQPGSFDCDGTGVGTDTCLSVIVTRGADNLSLANVKILSFDGADTTAFVSGDVLGTQLSKTYATDNVTLTDDTMYTLSVAGSISVSNGALKECPAKGDIKYTYTVAD